MMKKAKTLERRNTRETLEKYSKIIKTSVKRKSKPKLNGTRMILNLEKNY